MKYNTRVSLVNTKKEKIIFTPDYKNIMEFFSFMPAAKRVANNYKVRSLTG